MTYSDADAEAFGGLVVRNELKSDVDAYIDHAAVMAASIDLVAVESATLVAFNGKYLLTLFLEHSIGQKLKDK